MDRLRGTRTASAIIVPCGTRLTNILSTKPTTNVLPEPTGELSWSKDGGTALSRIGAKTRCRPCPLVDSALLEFPMRQKLLVILLGVSTVGVVGAAPVNEPMPWKVIARCSWRDAYIYNTKTEQKETKADLGLVFRNAA